MYRPICSKYGHFWQYLNHLRSCATSIIAQKINVSVKDPSSRIKLVSRYYVKFKLALWDLMDFLFLWAREEECRRTEEIRDIESKDIACWTTMGNVYNSLPGVMCIHLCEALWMVKFTLWGFTQDIGELFCFKNIFGCNVTRLHDVYCKKNGAVTVPHIQSQFKIYWNMNKWELWHLCTGA